MGSKHKFRFGVQTSRGGSAGEWAAKARKIEELGYSTLFIPDHFDDQLAPMPAMMAAADATTTLRIGGLVLDNDYKHPVVLAKELATIDVLSGGRLEVGIGAGWMESDYRGAGMAYDAPGVRISRLQEAVRVIKGLMSDEPVAFDGTYYNVHMNGTPKPVQKPHPPLLIGGGGKRVLRYAARVADIIGVNFTLTEGVVNAAVMATGGIEATKEKIAWIREAAGARFEEIELNVTVFGAFVTDDRASLAERLAPRFGVTAAEVGVAPHLLIGSVEQMVEDLQRRRELFGFSYIAISGEAFEALAPVVRKLAGT
ncbi:MAG TPA: TIGR03621 family F420-dependent LLM class oxidoreductase [Dehalococcoidia bacterium]|nr:TIGR03621 family F420-dependent LLM class oxidoreductase [Dehalococcoidia bacterium]